ncbi:MAG: DUF3892 domain-containing protein [Candidatus Aminicenantes bacterium]|nr:MAG: DUF3892 domain-containing protein [Candidatus Aminicenantes bacterium]
MALSITGRMENKNGANTHYRLSDGSIVTRQLAVRLRKKGLLKDYHIITVKGVEYLRDNPDPSVEDNIDKQPLLKSVKIKTNTKWELLHIMIDRVD